MKFFTVLFAVLSAVALSSAIPDISINGSYVPHADYEVDAVTALQEAYTLYPNNADTRAERFSQLLFGKHPLTGGWNVASGCQKLYISKKNYYFVALNVNDGNQTSIVKIYN